MKKLLASAIVAVLPFAAHAANYSYVFSDTADGTSSTLDTLEHGTAYTWGITNSSTATGSSGNLTTLETDLKNNSQTITSVTLTITGLHDWVSTEADDVLYANLLNGVTTGEKSFQYMPAETTFDTRYGDDPFNANSTLDGYTGNATSGSIGNWNGQTGTGSNSYYQVLQNESAGALPFGTAAANSLVTASEITSNLNGYSNPSGNPGTFSADDTGASFTLTYTLTSGLNSQDSLLDSFLMADNTTGTSTLGLGLGPDCYFGDTGITLTINTCTTAPEGGMSLTLMGLGLCGLLGFARHSKRAISIRA